MKNRRIHYAWVIFAVSYLMVFVALGFGSATKSIYLEAITRSSEMEITRGLYSFSDTFRFVFTAIANLLFGALVARFGAKKLIGAGFSFLILSFVVLSFSDQYWQFYLSGALLGIAFSFTSTTTVALIVEKWFPAKKGTMMGVILSANALGGLASEQIISRIVYGMNNEIPVETSRWRIAALVSTVIFAVAAVLVLIFIRNDPKDMKLAPPGEGSASNKRAPRQIDRVKWESNMIPINKRKIGVCILLSIVTFGIYQIYWEYLLVKNTRAIQKDESSCTGEMLCLVFVPFYSLFWWFTRGKIVKDKFAEHGYSAISNEIAYLILGIFGLAIVSMAIMQNDFNSLKSESTQSIQRSANKRGMNWQGYEKKKVTRSSAFWIFAICTFFSGFCLQAMANISRTHLKDIGIAEDSVKLIFSAYWIVLVLAKVGSGFLYDKFGLRVSYAVCALSALVASGCMLLVKEDMPAFAWFYSFIAPFAMPLETVMIPLVVSDLFGQRSYSSIVGYYMAFNYFGFAAGVPVSGFIFDTFGSFSYFYWITACLMLFVAVFSQIFITVAHKKRDRFLAGSETGKE